MIDCPFCGSDDVERVGHQWVCRCCSKDWLAFTVTDARFLAVVGIESSRMTQSDAGSPAGTLGADDGTRAHPRPMRNITQSSRRTDSGMVNSMPKALPTSAR